MTRLDERPILFSEPMIWAILENRKSQTRRVVKPQPGWNSPIGGLYIWKDKALAYTELLARCPYGAPGDRLWVRESFQPLFDDGARDAIKPDWKTGCGYAIRYMATEGRTEWLDTEAHEITNRCKPSIHLPRWASRITLEITEVRVQKVQEISEEDALAEGIWPPCPESFHEDVEVDPATVRYASLWDDINLKRGYNFNSNPWVWAISFRRLP